MSTDVMERVSEVQDQVIEFIDGLKEPVAEIVTTVAEFVTERVELQPVPWADQIPTPKEVIDNQSKFASKLVTTNKGVALGAARAAAPLTDPLLDRRATARKAATKTAATKKTATTKAASAKKAATKAAA